MKATKEQCLNGIKDYQHRIKEIDLIEEAKKRGFKDGVKIIDADTNIERSFKSFDDLGYFKSEDWLTDGYGSVIFCKGEWATIVNKKPIFTHKGVAWSKSTLKSMIDKQMK